MDISRIFTINEGGHRAHSPFIEEKYVTLGRMLYTKPGIRILGLGNGSGEMLCIWARGHDITGTGTDMSSPLTMQTKRHTEELDVSERVHFIYNDTADYAADEKCDVAACVDTTWIAGGFIGAERLLAQSPKPGGTIPTGEPY